MGAAVLALDLEVVRQKPRKISKVVQRSTADAPAGLAAVAVRVLAFEQEGRAGRANAPAPKVRADQIGELPVRPLFEERNLLAGLGQYRGVDRARRARADNGDIDFFMRCHGGSP